MNDSDSVPVTLALDSLWWAGPYAVN